MQDCVGFCYVDCQDADEFRRCISLASVKTCAAEKEVVKIFDHLLLFHFEQLDDISGRKLFRIIDNDLIDFLLCDTVKFSHLCLNLFFRRPDTNTHWCDHSEGFC